MKLLLSGFLPRDEMAFDLFLKRFMPTWRWHGQPAKRDHALLAADIFVIDLAAHGWSQCSETNLEMLALATGNSVAVLLMPPHDTSWQAASARHRSNWVWLGKPYNAEAMRGALSQAGELFKALQMPAAQVKPVVSRKATSSIAEAPVAPQPEPMQLAAVVLTQAVEPPLKPEVSAVEQGMNADELALRLSQCPADRRVLLRKLLAGLQAQVPFEIRFTMQHYLIIHPLDEWVAGNTPLPVVQRVAGSDALAASVSVRALGLDLVEDRLHQLSAVPQDLGEFLLQLASSTFPISRTDPVS